MMRRRRRTERSSPMPDWHPQQGRVKGEQQTMSHMTKKRPFNAR
jgi:hypothetical protein